jgi:hypothetical protein
VIETDGLHRWPLADPIRFERDLRVTLQALGWRSGRRHLPLRADLATTACWRQGEPHAPSPRCRIAMAWR